VKAIISGQTEGSLDSTSQLADRICEVAPQTTTPSISPILLDNTARLFERVEELSRQLASQRAPQTSNRSQPRDRHLSSPEIAACRSPETAPTPPSTLTHPTTPAGTNVISGRWPKIQSTVLTPAEGPTLADSLPPAGKFQQRSLTAANVCTTSSGRLFITDRVTKQQYLVDTGSDMCVFPRKLLPGRWDRTDYTLYAANGITIPTYGWKSRTLNLGLRLELTWRFVVADVQLPIIGVDLLSHNGLLVDCRKKRRLDGVTSLSTPGFIAPTLVPIVKVIAGGTHPDILLEEFRKLTKPAGRHPEMRHTTHHIRTTPGHPVTCRPRRLDPDRLAVA
jgi:hypothetical protein